MTLSEKLTQCRKLKNYSQQDVANVLGVSRQSVSRWETGEAVPTNKNLRRLAQFYGVSMHFFLDDEDPAAEISPPSPDVFSPASGDSGQDMVHTGQSAKKSQKKWLVLGIICAVAAAVLLILVPRDDGNIDLFDMRVSESTFDTSNVFRIDASYASDRFDIVLEPGGFACASSSFPIIAEGSVTVNAIYSPAFSDVDFGLITTDGRFFSHSGKDGFFRMTISIEEGGRYTFAVRNNSSEYINVTGFVDH